MTRGLVVVTTYGPDSVAAEEIPSPTSVDDCRKRTVFPRDDGDDTQRPVRAPARKHHPPRKTGAKASARSDVRMSAWLRR